EIIEIIVALEKESNHPLADAILRKFDVQNTMEIEVTNQIGKGLEGSYQGVNYRIGKPSSFENVSKEHRQLNTEWTKEVKTVVDVSADEEMISIIALMDDPNEEAISTIRYFQEQGVHTTLITGDSEMKGQEVAKQLGIDEVC